MALVNAHCNNLIKGDMNNPKASGYLGGYDEQCYQMHGIKMCHCDVVQNVRLFSEQPSHIRYGFTKYFNEIY